MLKTLVKGMGENIRKWKDILCLCNDRICITKRDALTENGRFERIYIKFPLTFFTRLGKISFQIKCKQNSPQIAKTILNKRKNVLHIMIFDLKLYYELTKTQAIHTK